MTVRLRIAVRCDQPFCGREQAALMPQAETVILELAQLAQDLTRDRWVQLGDKHFCPNHRRAGGGALDLTAAAGGSPGVHAPGTGPAGRTAAAVRFGGPT